MRVRTLFLYAIILLPTPLIANAQSNPDRKGLRGILGMRVAIEELSPTARVGGLSRDQLQTEVELRLRKAGVRILDGDSGSFLYLSVSAMKSINAPLYATNVKLEFYRLGTFVGFGKDLEASEQTLIASVWSKQVLGLAGSERVEMEIRQQVADLTDQLLNDYLAANPKR